MLWRSKVEVKELARELMHSHDFLYLGRGINYPIALEGALKLKEISYIHAEGYPAGEMKHGPIALIDEKMPVVVLAPRDRYFEKTMSNLKEVESRGGKVIVLTDDVKTASEVSRISGADAAESIALSYADRDDDTAPIAGLSHCGSSRHRCRSAAQSRQERHGRIMALLRNEGPPISQRTLSSLRHRNFRLLFFGTSLSHVGDFVQAMAQSWLVWTMTQSPFLLGVIGFCQALPRLLLGAVGGAIVDRLERRRLLLCDADFGDDSSIFFLGTGLFRMDSILACDGAGVVFGHGEHAQSDRAPFTDQQFSPARRLDERHRAQFVVGKPRQDRRPIARRRADQRHRHRWLPVGQRRQFFCDYRRPLVMEFPGESKAE